jgi:hypothetical protein
MFIERLIALFEVEIDRAKADDKEGIDILKKQLLEDHYEFPAYINNVEINE